MKQITFLSILLLIQTNAFAETDPKVAVLQFTDDVAYSQPAFYLLASTSFILLAGIMLFQSALVALAKTGRFKDPGAKAKSILRKGMLSISVLLATLCAVMYFADHSIFHSLRLQNYAFRALAILVCIEMAIIIYTYVLVALSSRRQSGM